MVRLWCVCACVRVCVIVVCGTSSGGTLVPEALMWRKTAKGKKKDLWPRPLRILLPCWYLAQILKFVSDWLTHAQARL